MLPPSTNRVRSRSSSLRASLRVPKKFIPFTAGEAVKQHNSLVDSTPFTEEPLSFSDEDLVDLAPEERAVATTDTPHPLQEISSNPDPPTRPLSTRTRRSLSRFSTVRRNSRSTSFQFASTETAESATGHGSKPTVNGEPPARPGTTVQPRTSTDTGRASAHSVSIDEPAFGFDTDPFQKDDVEVSAEYPKLIPISPLRVIEEVPDPNLIEPSPPATRVPSTSTITPSLAISAAHAGPLQRVLQRLRSFSFARGNRASGYYGGREIRQIFSDGHGAFASTSAHEELLPELAFDSTPLADLIFAVHVSEDAITYQDESGIFQPPLPIPPPAPPQPAADTDTAREQSLQVVKWQRVDPNDLTPSPYTSAATDISPAETPLIIPSPSWLSRNIFDLEFKRNANCLYSAQHISQVPPSPSPLPIPNRSLFPVSPYTPSSFIENLEPAESPAQSQSDGSSVTLYSPLKPTLRISPPTPRASSSRLSVVGHSKSPSDSKRSLNSFLTYASAALSANKENPLLSVTQDLPAARIFLLLQNQSTNPSPIDSTPSPLPLPINVTFDPFGNRTPITPARSLPASYQIYIPTQEAFEASKDTFPLPEYLRALVRSTYRNSKNYGNMSTDAYGKPADTVDWGDEVDYSNYEWFKNPPSPRPRAPQAAPQAAADPYVPPAGVVEENEAFEYALKAAPNVLYGRFKQYGQLGVLAWCSEFGEMIEALKGLGISGNMFVSTRRQALASCEEILALNLHEDIEMQIIVMYLSSQIARLRRFLDSDTQFEDYPQPRFPMDPGIQPLPGQM